MLKFLLNMKSFYDFYGLIQMTHPWRELQFFNFSILSSFWYNQQPFLLNGTIRHHFLKHERAYPKFVETFLEDLYVDDATSGANTITEGKEFHDLAKSIMLEAEFDL